MTRHDHHHPFGVGGGPGHHHLRGPGGHRSRTGTSESDSSVLSIRNIGDAPDLDDDVGAVRAMRALALRSFLGGDGRGGEGGVSSSGGGSGSRSFSPRSSPSPRSAAAAAAAAGSTFLRRRAPSFDAALSSSSPSSSSLYPLSPLSSVSPTAAAGDGAQSETAGGGRTRAWTAGDADLSLSRRRPPSRVGGGAELGRSGGKGRGVIRALSPSSSASSDPSFPSASSSPVFVDSLPLRAVGVSGCAAEADSRVSRQSPPTVPNVGGREATSEMGDKPAKGTKGLPTHSRSLFSRLTLRPRAAGSKPGRMAVSDNGMITIGSLESRLPGNVRGLHTVEKDESAFQDEYHETGEEEKREIVAEGNENEGSEELFHDEYHETREKEIFATGKEKKSSHTSGLGRRWKGVPLSPSLARRLPPRNEGLVEGEAAESASDDVPDAEMGMIEEEPSVGVTSNTSGSGGATGQSESDAAPARCAPEEFSDDDVGGDGPGEWRQQGHKPYYNPHGPIGVSRLDSLTTSERGNVLRAVKWVASTTSSSEDDDGSSFPDGFDDEGVYYMNSPMQTPMSGMGPGGDGVMTTAPFSPTLGPGDIHRATTNHDDMDLSPSHHSNLGSRHGEHKRKRSVKFERNLSVASGWGEKEDEYHSLYLCGRRVPFLRWPLFHVSISWSRVSSLIVRHAPCFWCAQRFETAATDRDILVRLNVLCTCFAAAQVGAGTFLLLVQWSSDGTDEENQLRRESLTPNLWTLNGMVFLLSLVGLVLVVTMLLTLKVIREVNLAGALRYMWALYWLLPIEILLVIGLFDVHGVTDVWVKHWWATPSMDWFRDHFCYNNTAHTKCTVPVGGGADYNDETEWCKALYNATDCRPIRDEAQEETRAAYYLFMTANGVLGLVLILLLFLALTLLEGIITPPIVQSSKQTNVPLWLTLPIIGCLAGGSVLLFSPSTATGEESNGQIFWIGVTYMTSAGTFFIAALLGWFISAFSVLNNRDKRHKEIAILSFILTMVLTVLSVAAIFSASLIYLANIVDVGLDDQIRGTIACYLDTANSCTNCDGEGDGKKCPEWTTDELVKVLQTQLKQSATLAAILSIYAISALRFGFVLRKYISKYQIDYV